MSTTKREIATKIKDKIVKFETCQQQQCDGVKKRVSGVIKERIELFEKSHGAIAKDKTICGDSALIVRTSNPEPPRLPPGISDDGIVDLDAEIACKPLWKGREYLKQLSTEELINNLRIIEKLRDSYIEEIKETSTATRTTTEEDSHDLEIHREEAASNPIDEEFGLSELHEDADSYIVEAYNSAGNELVISQLQFDHHEEVAHENPTYNTLLVTDDDDGLEFKNQWCQRDSQYSSGGSSEDSTYMSLKDCLSGSTILYENTRAMATPNGKGKNLKIKIDVMLDGDDDEDEPKCAPSEK